MTLAAIAQALGYRDHTGALFLIDPAARSRKPKPASAWKPPPVGEAIADDSDREREMRLVQPYPQAMRFDDDPKSRRPEPGRIARPDVVSGTSSALGW